MAFLFMGSFLTFAIRSFTDPPAEKYSHFATMRHEPMLETQEG